MVGPQEILIMADFNLEYSFEVSDLSMDNLSSAMREDEDMIETRSNLTMDTIGNSTSDVGNLAVLCGLTITNQSLKIVQVSSFFFLPTKKLNLTFSPAIKSDTIKKVRSVLWANQKKAKITPSKPP